uniref:Uncharacterized protein n=1 Tax=Ixodes ricinus TaxID=34613 RepID=A0A6B0U0Q0_IXORI
MFPQYCAVAAALFNACALRSLYHDSFPFPFHPIDDVYVTGDAFLKIWRSTSCNYRAILIFTEAAGRE